MVSFQTPSLEREPIHSSVNLPAFRFVVTHVLRFITGTFRRVVEKGIGPLAKGLWGNRIFSFRLISALDRVSYGHSGSQLLVSIRTQRPEAWRLEETRAHQPANTVPPGAAVRGTARSLSISPRQATCLSSWVIKVSFGKGRGSGGGADHSAGRSLMSTGTADFAEALTTVATLFSIVNAGSVIIGVIDNNSYLVPAPSDISTVEPSGLLVYHLQNFQWLIGAAFAGRTLASSLLHDDMKFISVRIKYEASPPNHLNWLGFAEMGLVFAQEGFGALLGKNGICLGENGEFSPKKGNLKRLDTYLQIAVSDGSASSCPVADCSLFLALGPDYTSGTFKGTCLCNSSGQRGHPPRIAKQSGIFQGFINASGCPYNGGMMHVFVLMEGISNISFTAHDKLSHMYSYYPCSSYCSKAPYQTPRSHDLYPLYICLCVHLKTLVYAAPVDDVGTLRNPNCSGLRNNQALSEIHQYIRVSMQWRIDACVRADGGNFEHIF
ncbi:hypothetical protein PR048_019910 [Dryococelus australis]|uniref:Uncharacterized protein n=1 Tax=Dryococelus australis TaxID=614101 RepID=A0ABQ9H4T4_9NEOP|nr:hypothetical protein PR048_019910 [Dryococelus australis]